MTNDWLLYDICGYQKMYERFALNISILHMQLEAYHFEKQQRSAKDAAAYLEKLWVAFLLASL